MSKKIAILTTREFYHSYDDYDCRRVIDSITDWEEVSNEDYNMLCAAQSQLGYSLIEQPADPKKFIANTISQWKKLAREQELKRLENERIANEKALKKKLRAEQKKTETKKQLLERLKKELGEV